MKEILIDKPKEFPNIRQLEYQYWLSVYGSPKALKLVADIKKNIHDKLNQEKDKFLHERN